MPIQICRAAVIFMKKFDVYEMVNNQIIDRLKQGVVPWHQPWESTSRVPRNLISNRVYRGFNFFFLQSYNFENPYFLTWNQIQEIGGSVKKGSVSYPVIFWKILETTLKDGTIDRVPYLRYYRVFNVESVFGIESRIPDPEQNNNDFNPIEICENLVSNWTDCPKIEHNHPMAAYYPTLDKVMMPKPHDFFSGQEYYSTLFHELIHSTGHRNRLNRHEKFPNHQFGSRDYSQEELVAEMGATYLAALCGIENKIIDNSAAYIKSWLSKLLDDNKFFVQACSYAQRAVDYIYDNQRIQAGSLKEFEFEVIESEHQGVYTL